MVDTVATTVIFLIVTAPVVADSISICRSSLRVVVIVGVTSHKVVISTTLNVSFADAVAINITIETSVRTIIVISCDQLFNICDFTMDVLQ